jgi:putrescine transport system ATP-binding protein
MTSSAAAPSDVRLIEIVKRFDDTVAVDGISLEIPRGSFFALLGPSGCGKTTTLRMIGGFEEPTEGRIFLGDQDVVGLPPYKRDVNTVFQSYALFPHMSIEDNVGFGLERRGVPKQERKGQVAEMLELVGLSGYGSRRPKQLSGGQQQRVALGRALVNHPRVLLLDEPLGALDLKLRKQMQLELKRIQHEVGITFVHVTHDQEEAMTMASRIAVMSEGRFLQVGTPSNIYETPNCRFVADFIGSVNLFEGHVVVDDPDHVVVKSNDCSIYVGHGITGTLGMEVGIGIRPEKIHLSQHQPASEHNWVHGEIVEMAYFGESTTYHVKLPSGLRIKVARMNHQRHGAEGFTWGDHVFLHWSDDAMVVVTQ